MKCINRKPFKKFLLILILSMSVSLQAADRIVHYYYDMVMGLAGGLNAYDAIYYSLSNEMIDSGVATHPMGLVGARLINHFLGTPMNIVTDGGFIRNGVAIATIEHPLAYTLLDIALKTGNKMMIGAVRHRLIDTFFHSGWSSLFGHMEGGHGPDHAPKEIRKAQACFQAIMELTFFIRDMTEGGGKENKHNITHILGLQTPKKLEALYQSSGTRDLESLTDYMMRKPGEYAEVLWYTPVIEKAFGINVENSSQYRDFALEELFKSMKKDKIIDINVEEYFAVRKLFTDIRSRHDLSPQDSFKLALYRVYQVLTDTKVENTKHLEITPELQNKLNLARLNGINDLSSLMADVSKRQIKEAHNLRFHVADFKDFLETNSNEWKPSSQLGMYELAKLEKIIATIISWKEVIDLQTLEPHRVESIRVGDIPDYRDRENFRKDIYNNDPQRFKIYVDQLSKLAENPEKLDYFSRLKAIAELASLAATEAHKDIIPNSRISTTQQVNFENDNLSHACFSSRCRETSARIAIAELFGINAELGKLGTLGAKEHVADFKQSFMAKIYHFMSKVIKMPKFHEDRQRAEDERLRLDSAEREFLLEIGLAKKMDDKIVTILDEANNKSLTSIKPNFTVSGLKSWFSWSMQELLPVIARFDMVRMSRSREIKKRVDVGMAFKSYFVQLTNYWYGDGTPVSPEVQRSYPLLTPGSPSQLSKEGYLKLTPQGNNVYFGKMRCSDILK